MSASDRRVVLGVDFGTLSGRVLVVRVADGQELGTALHEYAHGVIDEILPASGEPLPPDWALQDPEDYRNVLRHAVPLALAASDVRPEDVIGIGVDFTACTVLPTLRDGTPLCELAELRREPHAYPKLWRHHAAQRQADRITALAHERAEPWIGRYGGRISSEWEFAKALQLLEEAPDVYARAERWIEAADWITWQLTGVETRNACTAGYKGIYQDGRWPSRDYLEALNPAFADVVREKIEHPIVPLGARAGGLSSTGATLTGLGPGIAVSVANVDAHTTAPAARAIDPGQMVAIMGTSTCHVMNGDRVVDVPGICGVVEGGITPGLWGYEAGQSGVGDIFAWYVEHGVPPVYHELARDRDESVHETLTRLGADQPIGGHGLVALDWHSGNRSILVDHSLSGLVVGETLATRPPDVYRALLEATAFGTRTIIEAFEGAGVPVEELVIAGGLKQNEVLLQIYSDVTRRALSVIGSDQGPALGAAIHAAVAAGAYPDVRSASDVMGRVQRNVYRPNAERAERYDELYAEYARLHDYFGRGGNDVMHRLRAIRDRALAD